jgi:hypothetical protein
MQQFLLRAIPTLDCSTIFQTVTQHRYFNNLFPYNGIHLTISAPTQKRYWNYSAMMYGALHKLCLTRKVPSSRIIQGTSTFVKRLFFKELPNKTAVCVCCIPIRTARPAHPLSFLHVKTQNWATLPQFYTCFKCSGAWKRRVEKNTPLEYTYVPVSSLQFFVPHWPLLFIYWRWSKPFFSTAKQNAVVYRRDWNFSGKNCVSSGQKPNVSDTFFRHIF